MTAALDSAHARYRTRLEALASVDGVAAPLATAAAVWGWSECAWRRTYGRFHPGGAPFARLVLESVGPPQRIVRVDAYEDAGPPAAAGELVVAAEPVGWLRLTRFPADPVLTTLPELVAPLREFHVVRYRPAQRCTIRVADGGARFVKVFRDGRAAAVHAAGVAVGRAAARGELGFAVAAAERHEVAARAVWQEELRGESAVPRLLEPGGAQLAARVGRAAATLASSGLRPESHCGADHQLRRAAGYCRRICAAVPSLARLADEVLTRLAALHAAAPARPPRPVHGAPRPTQWLVDGDRLALVDFDGLALGDPELDASAFVAAPESEAAPAVAAAFLEGYAAQAGPLRPGLLGAYLAQRRLADAEKAVQALRPDGDVRAARQLERAAESLAGVAP